MAHWKLDEAECQAGLIGLEDFSRVLPPNDAPIVVWTTPTWSDQSFTWSTLERLLRLGVDAKRVWFSLAEEAFSVGAYTVEQLREALPFVREGDANDWLLAAR